MFKPDLLQREVKAPADLWCACGHQAPMMFRRAGATTNPEPTRFFSVKAEGIQGIYCEICLIIANYMSRQQKGKK